MRKKTAIFEKESRVLIATEWLKVLGRAEFTFSEQNSFSDLSNFPTLSNYFLLIAPRPAVFQNINKTMRQRFSKGILPKETGCKYYFLLLQGEASSELHQVTVVPHHIP